MENARPETCLFKGMECDPPLAPELAVVMPVYNEASNIACVLREWFGCLRIVCPNFIVFVVNDGSRDDTASILVSLQNELGCRLRVTTKPNACHGLSCREGYQLALTEDPELVFQIDSDGQCAPTIFPTLYPNRINFDC